MQYRIDAIWFNYAEHTITIVNYLLCLSSSKVVWHVTLFVRCTQSYGKTYCLALSRKGSLTESLTICRGRDTHNQIMRIFLEITTVSLLKDYENLQRITDARNKMWDLRKWMRWKKDLRRKSAKWDYKVCMRLQQREYNQHLLMLSSYKWKLHQGRGWDYKPRTRFKNVRIIWGSRLELKVFWFSFLISETLKVRRSAYLAEMGK